MPGDWNINSSRSSSSIGSGGPSAIRLRLKPKVVGAVVMVLFVFFIFLLLPDANHNNAETFVVSVDSNKGSNNIHFVQSVYNSTYPMSAPETTLDGKKYKIGLIADLDTNSKDSKKEHTWYSYFLTGHLTINSFHDKVSVEFDEQPQTIMSGISQSGRGMELSELLCFNGKLYTVDDRTGIIFEISGKSLFPWVILSDGDGKAVKGFKGEWMAKKNQIMFVGGLGKEWTTTSGELVNNNPQYVKAITHTGSIHHLSWVSNYNAMRKEAGFSYPGYMIHESGVWSDVHKRWYFLPRRASTEKYEEVADERRATNILFSCSENFDDIKFIKIGSLNAIRGYSSFKFIPGTKDEVIVALKTEEDAGKIATYITVFDLKGKILLPDYKFADVKYEGIEFI